MPFFREIKTSVIIGTSLCLLWLMACATTGKPSLVNFKVMSTHLALTTQQRTEIEPKVKEIKTIVDEYESERDALRAELAEQREQRRQSSAQSGTSTLTDEEREERRQRFRNSPTGQRFQQLRTKREKSQKRIDVLIAQINETLTDEQRQKFETEIQVPVLESEQRERRRRGTR